jgi:exopolyphosphatase/guanosine-5'-triphosphate,3'-diphosphate pyrophosphatase
VLKTASKNYECSAHFPVLGAIDIGTNSCRLLVASVNVARLGRNFFVRRQDLRGWRIIDSYARVVRLGEGLHEASKISEEAIERTLEALSVCRRKIDRNNVWRLRSVATEACRRATNGNLLIERAYEELKIKIDIISGDEEAKLILTGCAGVLDYETPYALVFDIGGGSTEAIWVRINYKARRRPGYPVPFEVIDTISLPYGVVTSTESHRHIKDCVERHHIIRDSIANDLRAFCERNSIYEFFKRNEVQLLGSSGTVTTLAAFQAGLPRYERRLVDGILLKTEDLRKSSQEILYMSLDDRITHPCIGKGRCELIIAGSSILEGIFDMFPMSHVRIADRGIREGILSELLVSINGNIPRGFDEM